MYVRVDRTGKGRPDREGLTDREGPTGQERVGQTGEDCVKPVPRPSFRLGGLRGEPRGKERRTEGWYDRDTRSGRLDEGVGILSELVDRDGERTSEVRTSRANSAGIRSGGSDIRPNYLGRSIFVCLVLL